MYSKEVAQFLHDRGLMPDMFYYANYGDPQKNLFIFHEQSLLRLSQSKEEQERVKQELEAELERQLPPMLDKALSDILRDF